MDTDQTLRRLAWLEERRRQAIRRTFQRLDPTALGAGIGVACALLLFVLTMTQALGVVRPPEPALDLLCHYLPGYETNVKGAFLGLLYGGGFGFVLGFLAASFRNLGLRVVLAMALWSQSRWRRRHMLDEIG